MGGRPWLFLSQKFEGGPCKKKKKKSISTLNDQQIGQSLTVGQSPRKREKPTTASL
jgi:hypothetical protein